jgi:hypothetical protein
LCCRECSPAPSIGLTVTHSPGTTGLTCDIQHAPQIEHRFSGDLTNCCTCECVSYLQVLCVSYCKCAVSTCMLCILSVTFSRLMGYGLLTSLRNSSTACRRGMRLGFGLLTSLHSSGKACRRGMRLGSGLLTSLRNSSTARRRGIWNASGGRLTLCRNAQGKNAKSGASRRDTREWGGASVVKLVEP